MKTGLTISALVHAALLLWGLISFSARPLEAAPKDALPVDIISDKEFSELTKGVKNAAKTAEPKPLVEKIGDPKPVEDSTAKVSEKREIKAAKAEAEPPPPIPEPRPAEAKQEKKKEPPKVDPIAEALKKDEAKRKAEEKAKESAKAQAAKRKPVPPKPAFDPNKIAALLDKRDSQRQAATGDALVPVPGLGTPKGSAPQLSQSEIDALRARLMELWNVPAGVQNPDELKITVLIRIGRDRKLGGPPRVLTSGTGPLFVAARDSAVRALFLSQPFDMLRPEHYELWKEIEITFDPRYMFRG
jgi:colicin import membrane protein